ncbi:MAG: 4-hydroxybenzoate octaprenyltransferase [Rickettsiaceae bacterium]|nr:4-hydroxybenzoate octaprenyltransferase [Rickettsiaceae bacterium]
MPNKLSSLLALIRFNNQTGTFLLFFPCVFGVMLAAQKKEELIYIVIFLIGSFVMRSAGCIINDLWDKELDKKVSRTKNRPLATGAVTVTEAILFLLLFLMAGLVILSFLSWMAIGIACLAMVLVTLYPLMKRITFWPQIFLGITYNSGLLIAYTTITNGLYPAAICTYIGCIFWTTGYDTIYAFMDRDDDEKAGIKSTALFLKGRDHRKWIISSYGAFLKWAFVGALLSPNNNFKVLVVCTICEIAIFLWQVQTLDTHSKPNCLTRFKSNVIVGLIWSIALI